MQQRAPKHTHNVQPPQGVVLKQRFCNNNEADGADIIVVLQKNCGSAGLRK
jgi:hypothetical protein